MHGPLGCPPPNRVSASTIRLEDTERCTGRWDARLPIVFQRARSDLRILKGKIPARWDGKCWVSASTIRLEDTESLTKANLAEADLAFQRARSDLRILKDDVGQGGNE